LTNYDQLAPEYEKALESYSGLSGTINNLMLLLNSMSKQDGKFKPLHDKFNETLSTLEFENLPSKIDQFKLDITNIQSEAGLS
jgi:hypothetical protein